MFISRGCICSAKGVYIYREENVHLSRKDVRLMSPSINNIYSIQKMFNNNVLFEDKTVKVRFYLCFCIVKMGWPGIRTQDLLHLRRNPKQELIHINNCTPFIDKGSNTYFYH